MTVKEPVVSDIEAPEAGKRLDDKALVTTAEKEQWEVPVLWVSSDGQVISGTASDNRTISGTAVVGRKYLPVIAYVVPENYTIANTDESAGTYMLKFTKDVTKLFGVPESLTFFRLLSRISLPPRQKTAVPPAVTAPMRTTATAILMLSVTHTTKATEKYGETATARTRLRRNRQRLNCRNL